MSQKFSLSFYSVKDILCAPLAYIQIQKIQINMQIHKYINTSHRVEDVLSLLTSLLPQSVIRCQLRVRIRQQNHLEIWIYMIEFEFVHFIFRVRAHRQNRLLKYTRNPLTTGAYITCAFVSAFGQFPFILYCKSTLLVGHH